MTTAEQLYERFRRCWDIQVNHPWRARLGRLPRASALLSQKLGRRRWADVPLFHGERMRVLVGETVSRAILGFGFA